MKRAGELALFLFVLHLVTGCIVEVEKVVPTRATADDVIDLRDPVGGSLWMQGTVFFDGIEAPMVLNWGPEDVFVRVPAGLTGGEVPVYVEIQGLRSNVTRLSILESDPLLKVMCFGDSIIYGGVPSAVQRFLDQDPTLSGLEPVVLDQGKPMEFISREATWTRWLNALDYHAPDLVILLEATNDVRDHAAVPMADIQQGLIRMVDEAMGRGLHLILCTLLPRVGQCDDVESPTAEAFNAWLVPYAALRGIPLVDLHREFLSTPGWEQAFFNADDCLHPNGKGKTRIGELLTEKIEEVYLAGCTDMDGDGYGDPAAASCPKFGRDCDDGDLEVHPAPVEEACHNGLDDDCDGLADGLDEDCMGGFCADPAEAAVYGKDRVVFGASQLLSCLASLFLPVGLAIAWASLRRKRARKEGSVGRALDQFFSRN